jgi:4'-phosphopantetheinyl transferase
MVQPTRAVPSLAVLEFSIRSGEQTTSVLPPGEIHVWQRSLECNPDELESCRRLLSPDETERAARFRFTQDRVEFIVARGTLRALLKSYLGRPHDSLQFIYSQFGKPELAETLEQQRIEFNVSHSGGVALLAFARDRRIGIDIEQVRRDFSTLEISERFFSEAERDALRQLPLEQRPEAFFRCWARKEAFIKALGEGLSHPLDSFDVSLMPGEPAQLLATRPDDEVAKRWAMWEMSVPKGYAAALAAERK